MTRLLTNSLLVAGLLLVGVVPAEASGFCAAAPAAGVALPLAMPVAVPRAAVAVRHAAPLPPVAAPAPQYVERKVTRYKSVVTEREVEKTVNKSVWEDEAFTYQVMVPKTYTEKRKVVENQMQTEAVAFTYTVCVPKNYTEKRTVTSYK